MGAGTTGAFIGDFDGDGLLDVFAVSSEAASRLWDNRGGFEFVDTMAMTGELSYKGGSAAIGGMAGDFNNDSRQDVLFYYAADAPHIYFSRGFRTFGMANTIDPGLHSDLLPDGEKGQQAGCLADLNGDGAQDMVLILKNGEAWVFYPEAAAGAAHTVRAALPLKGALAGPVTVSGWQKDRCLGAWNVTPGTTEASFGLPKAGTVTLKWKTADGKAVQKDVAVDKTPVRVLLAP
jgi:hypothetical protein